MSSRWLAKGAAGYLLTRLARLLLLLLACHSLDLLGKCQAGNVDHCYSDLGCFPLSAEFYHPRHRPFNVRPWHRRRIKTTFTVYNRRQPDGFQLEAWDGLGLASSRFDPMLETKVIIPGWLDNAKRALWVRRLRDALLWLWKACNIIIVEWRNFTPYTVATANTRVVGAELANLLRSIEHQLNYNRHFFHLIGHSLGAHIGGYAGDRLPGLGRITALDPARPFFQHMPKSVRLDRGDARFVDAIHSDFTPENAILFIMSFGMTTPVGHLDFYPNGPALLQPGCLRDSILAIQTGIRKGLEHNSLPVAFLESMRYLTACDHQRAHQWFTESVTNRKCLFVGVRCNEFEGMINGRCTCADSPSACAIMGIHADQMYLAGVHEELWPARKHKLNEHNFASSLENHHNNRLELYGRLHEQALARSRPPPPQLLNQLPGHKFPSNEVGEEDEEEQDGPEVDSIEQSISADHLFYAYLRQRLQPNTSATTSGEALELAQAPSGHPRQLSEVERDLESWYEQSSRWHLRTNDRPDFCLNQYQLLVFMGPTRGAQRIKGNLLISIIGSRGQIERQRFKPRGEELFANTMQPFFILLEGSYSLGAIRSVAVAWERRPRADGAHSAPEEASVAFDLNQLELLPELKRLGSLHKLGSKPNPDPNSNRSSQATRRHEQLLLDENLIALGPPPPPEEPRQSIVINKVIVSPLEAHYGNGRAKGAGNARVFCPPEANFRLARRQTVRLHASLLARCHNFRPARRRTSVLL